MMELTTGLLEESIKFHKGKVNLLEINNKELFNKLIYMLNRNINIDDLNDEVYLYEDNIEISINKNCMLIYDFFNVFANQSKILKRFYEDIAKEYSYVYEEEGIIKLQKKLLQSIKDILMEYDYELTYKEFMDIKDILKILDVKFNKNFYDKPLDNLFLLIDLISNFNICRLIILVNAKCFFSKQELDELYKIIIYKRINVLFIEYYKDELSNNYESKILIDEDFDEFYFN